jgi:hypothetical protein
MASEKPDPDSLAKTSKDDVTLSETDLDHVSGGALNAYMKIDGAPQNKGDNKG